MILKGVCLCSLPWELQPLAKNTPFVPAQACLRPTWGRCSQLQTWLGAWPVALSSSYSSSSWQPRLQKHPERSSCKTTKATPGSSVGVFSYVSYRFLSAVHFFFSRNVLLPKNLNNPWEAKACLFQRRSQTGMRWRAWPLKLRTKSPSDTGTAEVGQGGDCGCHVPVAVTPSEIPVLLSPLHLLPDRSPGSPHRKQVRRLPRGACF